MMGRLSASKRAFCTALICAVAVGAPAFAGDAQDALRQGLMRNRGGETTEAPMLARYVSEDGRAFILDRSQGRPLLKFEDGPEIWVLATSAAPRGDVIYKNDLGEPVLRATRLGGYTLFSETRPAGAAASMDGPGAALRLPVLGPQALGDRLLQASYRAGRAARHTIVFQAEATPASSALIGDAAVITTLAILRVAQRKNPGVMLAGLNKVLFEEGRKPSVSCANGVLRVVIAPADGVAGRPSSFRIEQVLRKS